MKFEKLNLGSPLSRDEQKKIKGGENPCPTGKVIPDCECFGQLGTMFCILADGGYPLDTCSAFCASAGIGPTAGAVGCTTSCPGPGD